MTTMPDPMTFRRAVLRAVKELHELHPDRCYSAAEIAVEVPATLGWRSHKQKVRRVLAWWVEQRLVEAAPRGWLTRRQKHYWRLRSRKETTHGT